jgi:hypothetical protein
MREYPEGFEFLVSCLLAHACGMFARGSHNYSGWADRRGMEKAWKRPHTYLCHYAVCANYASFANGYAAENRDSSTNPAVILYRDVQGIRWGVSGPFALLIVCEELILYVVVMNVRIHKKMKHTGIN